MEGPTYPAPQAYPTDGYTPSAPQGYQPPPQPQPGYQPAPADFKGDPKAAVPPAYYGPPLPAQQQQACNVVVTQPQVGVGHIPYHSVGDNYLTLSVVLTVLCFLCCTWYGLFCTVPAIIFATMARDAEGRGNYAAARSNANLALGCNIAGVVWWVLATCVIIISVSVVYATGGFVYYYYSPYCTYYYYYSYCYYK